MKIYYDGASIKELSEVLELGIISGVTTNLTFSKQIMKKNNVSYEELQDQFFKKIKSYKEKKLSLSFQVTQNEPKLIYDEAVSIYDKYCDVDLKIKVPVNYENFKVIDRLVSKGVKINATCVTSYMQGLSALNAGCSYISFFWGRMTDEDIDAASIIMTFRDLLDRNQMSDKAKILVGSIRQPQVISEAFKSGSDIVTIQYPNFKKMLNQLKSNESNDIFQKDWKG